MNNSAAKVTQVDAFVERLANQRSTVTSRRATREDDHLPLHAVAGIKPMSMPTITQIATAYANRCDDAVFRALQTRMNTAIRLVESNKPYRAACTGPDKDRKKISHVSKDDILRLLQADIIEIATGPGLRTGRLFSVVEARKKRRRSIYWPKWLNAELSLMGIPTPLLADILCSACDVRPGTFARTFDLSSSFYQVELAEDIRDYFHFLTADGKRYRLKRMPMGACTSPEILQSVVSLIAHIALEGMHAAVDCTVHIDNVRFSGLSKNLVTRAGDNFVHLCKLAGITLNVEEGNALHQHGTFLGMLCDYAAGTVCLTDDSITKLKDRADAALAPGASVQDLFRLFGTLSFASRVLRVPPAAHYTFYKYIRRLSSKYLSAEKTLDSPADLWPCARKDIQQWIDEISPNRPVRHVGDEDMSEPLVIVSDASTSGWGAILADENSGQVWQTSGKWSSKQDCSDINTLEMHAVHLALRAFSDILDEDKARPLIILVDNTSTAAVLRKGSAREYTFNSAALATLKCLAGDRPVVTDWISTAENFADPLSRGEPVQRSDDELVSALGAFGRRLGRSALRVRVPAESVFVPEVMDR